MRQGPIVEELGEEGYAVGKLDVDQNMELAQQLPGYEHSYPESFSRTEQKHTVWLVLRIKKS